jgi:hypothetical protein
MLANPHTIHIHLTIGKKAKPDDSSPGHPTRRQFAESTR